MSSVQTITGNGPAQVRDLAIAGANGRQKVRVALSPSNTTMFVLADTISPSLRRKSDRKAWSKGKIRSFCNLRLSGLRKLIQGRHNGPCDTDDGEAYYSAALPHLVAKVWAYGVPDDRVQSAKWAAMLTPNLWAEKPTAWFEEQEQELLLDFDNNDGRPSLPGADDVARALGITHAEVKAYDLRTIGAVDRLKDQRIADEREADRLYQAEKRASKGATPHSQSISALKPWLDYGIKTRRTWERKIERGELPPHPAMRPRVANSSDDVNSSETNTIVLETHFPDLAPPDVSECPTADNDDTPDLVTAPALPVTETGYVGRHIMLSASEVQHIVSRHPVLADDIRVHLDWIDQRMRKTTEPYRKVVLRNLSQDRARAVSRTRRVANDNVSRAAAA